MGLGKTFQSICTLWMLLTSGLTGRPTCSRALIITPTSLVANWGAGWIADSPSGACHALFMLSCCGDLAAASPCSTPGRCPAASPPSSCETGREVDKWLGGRIKPTVVEDATQLKVGPSE
jgi:hypothetical protein